MTRVQIERGDLTAVAADAIVNAANSDLVLGGGLAGAIRQRGGPSIQAQCDAHGPVRVGEAAITGAGDLPAKYVIHQASMAIGERTTPDSLRQSTRAVLRIAERSDDIRTLAFPAVGTGIAGFDISHCAQIMLEEVKSHIAAGTRLTRISFVLFDERTHHIFQRMWESLGLGENGTR